MRNYNPLAVPQRVKTEVVKLEGKIGRETEKAILFTIYLEGKKSTAEEDMKDVWFPLSQVTQIHRTYSVVNDTLDSIVVTQWIASQKELV